MDAFNLYFVGTAGCGKSTLTASFYEWLQSQGYDAVLVNLDPGAEFIPYESEVDIREWVRLTEIMDEYGLGPNGAQVAAADMLALNTPKVVKVLNTFETDFVLFDTPGQLELFTFRESSRQIIDSFGADKSGICFLIDAMLSRDPNGFVSASALAAITSFRLNLPLITRISKADLLSEEELDKIESWSDDYSYLFNALMDGKVTSQNTISIEFLRALETVGTGRGIGFVSSETMLGMEDIYTFAQEISAGGEDLVSR